MGPFLPLRTSCQKACTDDHGLNTMTETRTEELYAFDPAAAAALSFLVTDSTMLWRVVEASSGFYTHSGSKRHCVL